MAEIVDWSKVIGDKTLEDGGYVGDLMAVARVHLADAKSKGELTVSEVGESYVAMIPGAFEHAIQYSLAEGLTNSKLVTEEKSQSIIDNENAIKEAKLVNERLIAGYHVDANGVWSGPIEQDASGYFQIDKLGVQKGMLTDQALMTGYDRARKEEIIQAELDMKAKQLEQIQADVDFNKEKKVVMVHTRKDNIRMKAAEQFAEFMKYISAANVIPGSTDFTNMRNLISGINNGIANPDSVASVTDTQTNYVKP